MARKINAREIYIVSTRKFVTWKAHSAHQTRASAKLEEDKLAESGQYGRGNVKIEQVTLNG